MMREDLIAALDVRVGFGEITENEILMAIQEAKKETFIKFEISRVIAELEAQINSASKCHLLERELSCCDESNYNDDGIDRFSACYTPPDIMIQRRETFESLSENSKDVIKLILQSSPQDFRPSKYRQGRKIFTPKNHISKQKLVSVLKDWGWNMRLIQKTFNELKTYTNGFCG